MKTGQKVMLGLAVGLGAAVAAGTAHGIDNSSIGKPEFREHKATYGLVYKLPKDVTDVLGAKMNGPLREKLLMLGLKTEADTFNIPHVTVVHVHSADPGTPKKMLDVLPKVPAVLKITLKDFYTTEASRGAGRPWWLDLGIVKSGQSFEKVFDTNVRGPYFLVAKLAPQMLAKGGGAIVNISTMGTAVAIPGASAYSASKAALESLTKTWALEFAPQIRVNAVAPGPALTEGTQAEWGDQMDEVAALTAFKRLAGTGLTFDLVVLPHAPPIPRLSPVSVGLRGFVLRAQWRQTEHFILLFIYSSIQDRRPANNSGRLNLKFGNFLLHCHR
jgi:NAD(P)-dependent dehydrogenase (short-subunit alcohol dehydrogenase family)